MIFSLEVLKAKHGDCLILHYGEQDQPELVLIDGGPAGVFREFLRPRLEALRRARSPAEELPIRLVVVSHNDDAHMTGLVDLFDDLIRSLEVAEPPRFSVRGVWHNGFDHLVGDHAEELVASARAEVGSHSIGAEVPSAGLSFGASQVLASVPTDRRLRDQGRRLKLPINVAGSALLTSDAGRQDLGSGVSLTVLSPSPDLIGQEVEQWDFAVKERRLEVEAGLASAAALADKSVYRFSSLVLLAEAEGKTMLLTGDARSDDIVVGLREAGFLTGERYHVDVLKVPAHGSDRNVDPEFFRVVTADHYVFSADGRYGDPDPETFRMILAARQGEAFELHLTYPPEGLVGRYPLDKLRAVLEGHGFGAGFTVRHPAPGAGSLTVDLLDPLAD